MCLMTTGRIGEGERNSSLRSHRFPKWNHEAFKNSTLSKTPKGSLMLEKDGVEEEEGTVRSCSHRCLLYSISGTGGLSHAILGASLPSVLVVSVSTVSLL